MVQGVEPMISGRRNLREPIDYDRVLYREHNIVKRSIGWVKQSCCMATRYEKTAASYLGFGLFAAARQWLRNPLADIYIPSCCVPEIAMHNLWSLWRMEAAVADHRKGQAPGL